MASSLTAYLPQTPGLLPKWLLLVRLPASSPTQPTTLTLPLITGLRSLHRQQHPSLHLPRPHPPRLLRHRQHHPLETLSFPVLPRHPPLSPHLRHMDAALIHHTPVRRVPHHESAGVRVGVLDVRGCLGPFPE